MDNVFGVTIVEEGRGQNALINYKHAAYVTKITKIQNCVEPTI